MGRNRRRKEASRYLQSLVLDVLVGAMTSQMEADRLLEEHRAVMAALIRSEISRPTEDQYESQLSLLREEMGSEAANGRVAYA